MRKSQDLWVCTSVEEFIQNLRGRKIRIAKRRVGKKRYVEYLDTTCTLDIEDYATADDGYIYSIQVCFDNLCVVLRYMEDVVYLFSKLEERYLLSPERLLVVYVHNLGHEHYHMTQILAEEWGRPGVLLTKPKKPLCAKYDNGIEFRDSLKLFQKSLALATKGCKHEKMVGDLNYSKKFTPDTPFSPDEWNYVVNDVQGLYEAIERLKVEHGYNQATIPYTNTGMVLQEVDRRCRANNNVFRAKADLVLNRDQLKLAYECMAGGDTHGARWRAGYTYYNCNSYDLKSAHPSQQILWKFPKGKPFMLSESEMEREDLELLIDNDHGWLGYVYVADFHIKSECPDPTVSASKCFDIRGSLGEDNGRVLGGTDAIIKMDSNDWQRFRQAYDYSDMCGVKIMAFQLGYLPEEFRQAVLDFFRVKESAPDGSERTFAKICVNTIFGACAQKTVRDEYTLTIEDVMEVTKLSWEENLGKMSDQAILNSQLKKLPFLWGLWTASLSRLALFNLIKTVGWDKAIYWDTDSCKFEGAKVPAVDAEFNARIRKQCIDRDAVVTNRKGKEVCIGVAEDEHPQAEYGYKAFRFLHAKCYAVVDCNDKLEVTISGVRKENGAKALKGDINNLADGLFIADAGGLALTYHDMPVRERTDFMRKTRSASWIEMNPRQYLVTNSPDKLYEESGEIIAG